MRRYLRETEGELYDRKDRTWWLPIEDRLTVELCRSVDGTERRVIRKDEIEEAVK
jgi:hypothetical protein